MSENTLELTPNAKKALFWIVDILEKNKIPFHITGGLAAKIYGAKRPLADIDIDIPEDKFEDVKRAVSEYITFGPERFQSVQWDLFLMTLDYHGQLIDLSGAYKTKIFDAKNNKWVTLCEDLSLATIRDVDEKKLPVIPKNKLITYKKILAREEDIIDVEMIENFI